MAEPIKSYAMVAQAAVNLAQSPKDKARAGKGLPARLRHRCGQSAMATAAAAAAVDIPAAPARRRRGRRRTPTAASLAKARIRPRTCWENFARRGEFAGSLPLLQDVIGYITERADGNATVYQKAQRDVEWIGDVTVRGGVRNKYQTGKTTSARTRCSETGTAERGAATTTGEAGERAARCATRQGVYEHADRPRRRREAHHAGPPGKATLNRIPLSCAWTAATLTRPAGCSPGQGGHAEVRAAPTPPTPATAARSTVTKLYSKAYQQADSEERAEMLDALMGLEYGGERRARSGHRDRLGRDGGQRRHYGGAGHGGRRRGAGDDRREGAAAGAGRRGSGGAGKPDDGGRDPDPRGI